MQRNCIHLELLLSSQVEEMIKYVKRSFRESLLNEDWIEEDMKVALVEKVTWTKWGIHLSPKSCSVQFKCGITANFDFHEMLR